MDMIDPPDVLMRGMAWFSLAFWVSCEWMRASRGESHAGARSAFTLGILAMLAHSVLAFAVRYGFSHEAALLDAARQIEEVTGRPSSPRGFYANHAFMAWWAVEAFAWWRAPASYTGRPLALVWASRLVFAFMFANGAITFARGPVRALGVLGMFAVFAAWAAQARWRR